MADAEKIIALKRALREVRRLNKDQRSIGKYHSQIERVCAETEKLIRN